MKPIIFFFFITTATLVIAGCAKTVETGTAISGTDTITDSGSTPKSSGAADDMGLGVFDDEGSATPPPLPATG